MDRWQYLGVQELRQEVEQEQPEVLVEVDLGNQKIPEDQVKFDVNYVKHGAIGLNPTSRYKYRTLHVK